VLETDLYITLYAVMTRPAYASYSLVHMNCTAFSEEDD